MFTVLRLLNSHFVSMGHIICQDGVKGEDWVCGCSVDGRDCRQREGKEIWEEVQKAWVYILCGRHEPVKKLQGDKRVEVGKAKRRSRHHSADIHTIPEPGTLVTPRCSAAANILDSGGSDETVWHKFSMMQFPDRSLVITCLTQSNVPDSVQNIQFMLN